MKKSKIFYIIICIINIILFCIIISNRIEYIKMKKENDHLNTIINKKHSNPNKLPVDSRLIDMFNQFNNDHCKHLNSDLNYEYLDEIIVGDLTDNGWWGVTYQYECIQRHIHSRIIIDDKILTDTIGRKIIFYHEMGHFMGRLHTYCDERLIMNWEYTQRSNDEMCDENKWEDNKLLFFRWEEVEDKLIDCYEK